MFFYIRTDAQLCIFPNSVGCVTQFLIIFVDFAIQLLLYVEKTQNQNLSHVIYNCIDQIITFLSKIFSLVFKSFRLLFKPFLLTTILAITIYYTVYSLFRWAWCRRLPESWQRRRGRTDGTPCALYMVKNIIFFNYKSEPGTRQLFSNATPIMWQLVRALFQNGLATMYLYCNKRKGNVNNCLVLFLIIFCVVPTIVASAQLCWTTKK